MEIIVHHDYPRFEPGNIKVRFRASDIPQGVAETIEMPFENLWLSEIDVEDIPEGAIEAPAPIVARAFLIEMPGTFYEHINEDRATVALITCEPEKIVMRSDMISAEVQSRLVQIYAKVHRGLADAAEKNRTNAVSSAEQRLMELKPAA